MISSYSTSTNAPPMPLNTLDQAPLKKALDPSCLAIFFQQSIVPVYMISAVKTSKHIMKRVTQTIKGMKYSYYITHEHRKSAISNVADSPPTPEPGITA